MVYGARILNELSRINQLHRGKVEQANFAVLKAPDIPSVLMETAFLSHPEEEKKLRTRAFQRKLAYAIGERDSEASVTNQDWANTKGRFFSFF